MKEYSDFGKKLAGPSGTQALMEDLGEAMTISPQMRMLGGGQPSAIPEVQALWRDSMKQLLESGEEFDRMVLNYDPPHGNPKFRTAFAQFLRKQCGWEVSEENLIVLPSSQSALFLVFNLLAGTQGDALQKILFPLCPEYIGYASQASCDGMMKAVPSTLTLHGDHEFKYGVDFAQVETALDTGDIAALCVSCPSNPTGNVLSPEEFERLANLAKTHDLPLIVDHAYGYPFPSVLYKEFKPIWKPGMIFSISLSKLGLPGLRTSIIVADPKIVNSLSCMNAHINLATSNVGQALLMPYLKDDRLLRLGEELIRPFYSEKIKRGVAWIQEFMPAHITWRLHQQGGAFFLWLWLPDLKISSQELYQRLKEREVLVIPGEHFFYGLSEDWAHSQQCLRLTVSQSPEVVREGLRILCEEVAKAC